MALPPKQALRDELIARLEADLAAAEAAQKATVEGATHPEAKAEDDKDTRALEQSYLARGQAMRVEELRVAIGEVRAMSLRKFRDGDPIGLSAVVHFEEDETEGVLFMAPESGGAVLAEGQVQVVTPKSALGRALMKKRAGDECEVKLPKRTRNLVLTKVE